jgi:hypothetical protein
VLPGLGSDGIGVCRGGLGLRGCACGGVSFFLAPLPPAGSFRCVGHPLLWGYLVLRLLQGHGTGGHDGDGGGGKGGGDGVGRVVHGGRVGEFCERNGGNGDGGSQTGRLGEDMQRTWQASVACPRGRKHGPNLG